MFGIKNSNKKSKGRGRGIDLDFDFGVDVNNIVNRLDNTSKKILNYGVQAVITSALIAGGAAMFAAGISSAKNLINGGCADDVCKTDEATDEATDEENITDDDIDEETDDEMLKRITGAMGGWSGK